MTPLHYEYSRARSYCSQLGMIWLGDDFVRSADADAYRLGMTQEMVDCAMQHHLWQVKFLFSPRTYSWPHRIGLALWFLFGWGKIKQEKHRAF